MNQPSDNNSQSTWKYITLVSFVLLIMFAFAAAVNSLEKSNIGINIYGLHLDYFGSCSIGFLLIYILNKLKLSNLLSPKIELMGLPIGILCLITILSTRDFSLYSPPNSTSASVIALTAPMTFLMTFIIFCLTTGFTLLYRENKLTRGIETASLILLIILAMWLSSNLLINDAHIYNANPLNFSAYAYSIAQVINGNALLVNFTNQYGYYAHILEPIFSILGELTVFKIGLVNFLIFLTSSICMIYVIYQLTKRWLLTLVTYSALVFCQNFIGHLWPYELYYQYLPLRIFFPTTTIAILLLYYQTKIRSLRNVLYLWGGISLIWNPDSGAAVCLTIIIFNLIEDLNEKLKPEKMGGVKSVKIILSSILKTISCFTVVFLLFLIYLESRYRNEGGLHLDWIFSFQRAYTLNTSNLSNFLQNPWLILFIIYFLAIALAVKSLFETQKTKFHEWDPRLVILICTMGLGLLTYNVARDMPTGHSTGLVSWPAFIVLSIFLNNSLVKESSNKYISFNFMKDNLLWIVIACSFSYFSANMIQTIRLNQILYYQSTLFNLETGIGRDNKILYYAGKGPISFGDYKKGGVTFPWVERVDFIKNNSAGINPNDLLILSPFDFYISMKTKTKSYAEYMNFCHAKEENLKSILNQLENGIYKAAFLDDDILLYSTCGWYKPESMKRIVSYIESHFKTVDSKIIDQQSVKIRYFQRK